MSLNHEQISQLLRPINPRRVSHMDGQSHLEAYDVRAHLSRIFGFGEWSEDVTDLTMLYEQSKEETSGTRWRAAYRATVRLTIHATGATFTEAAVGTNFGWLPDSKRDETHDMAIKTAASQALKRCAINLGDQFGLSLYNKGATGALVGRTLNMPPETPQTAGAVYEALIVDEHVMALAPETPAPQAPAPPAGQDWAAIIHQRVTVEAPTKGTRKKTFLLKQLTEAAAKNVAGDTVIVGGVEMSVEQMIQEAVRAA